LPIRLRVTWANPSHELLTEVSAAEVVVEIDGAPASPVRMSSPAGGGPKVFPEFEVPDGSSTVTMWVRFVGKKALLAVGASGTPLLLDVSEVWRVQTSGDLPLVPVGTPHPLVDTVVAGSAAASAVVARVATEFVDFTEYWFDIVQSWLAQCYRDDAAAELASLPAGDRSQLRVLGFTGGAPGVWFATVPDRCGSLDSAEAAALVFFRPTNHYHYQKTYCLDTHQQYGANRYLLKPRNDSAEGDTARDVTTDSVFYLRIGLEDAVRRSGKKVVLLTPFPNAGDFGLAAGARLPELATAAVRCLRGLDLLGRNQPRVTLGRLGIAAFSDGGYPLFAAFSGCKERVSELYALDCIKAGTVAGSLARWAYARPGVRLRMTGAVSQGTLRGIYLTAQRLMSAGTIASTTGAPMTPNDPGNVSIWPDASTAGEILAAWDGNAWWQRVTTGYPERRNNNDYRHQFAASGGETEPKTFLQDFLERSGFA
jgi:hypothetical protein